MAPKDAGKAATKTWNDALEKKFLFEIIERGGASASAWNDIAAKWGPPHTKGSLRYVSTASQIHVERTNVQVA
jgi:hypothetical protein